MLGLWQRLGTCGAAARAVRLIMEPGDKNVSDALTKPLDQRRMTTLLTPMGVQAVHIVGAGGSVTKWKTASCPSAVVSGWRDGRVAQWWRMLTSNLVVRQFGGTQLLVKTLANKSGIRDSELSSC